MCIMEVIIGAILSGIVYEIVYNCVCICGREVVFCLPVSQECVATVCPPPV